MEHVSTLLDEVIAYLSQPFPADQNPSPHARLVLLALASYLTRTDRPPGFPDLDNIERVTHLSRRTIRRHMRQWEAWGVLKTWHAHWGHERFDAYVLFPSGSAPTPARRPG